MNCAECRFLGIKDRSQELDLTAFQVATSLSNVVHGDRNNGGLVKLADGLIWLNDLQHHTIGHCELRVPSELGIGNGNAFLRDGQAHDVAKERHRFVEVGSAGDDPPDAFSDAHWKTTSSAGRERLSSPAAAACVSCELLRTETAAAVRCSAGFGAPPHLRCPTGGRTPTRVASWRGRLPPADRDTNLAAPPRLTQPPR